MVWHSKYTTSWRMSQPVDEVWRLMADTARLNEAIGIPRQSMEEIPKPDGDVERIARMKVGPVELEWVERPYEWIESRWFRHDIKAFRRGPFKAMCAETRLRRDGDGTVVEYELAGSFVGPAGLFMRLSGFLRRSAEKVANLAQQASDSGPSEIGAFADAVPDPEVDSERLERLCDGLAQNDFSHGLARRLADLIATAMEVDVDPIRPRTLARAWEVSEREVVELCLAAVRAGVLDMSWDVLCPRCRGAKASTDLLTSLQQEVHCPSCNIDYDAAFSRNVEVTFRPNPSIRRLQMGAYCLSGPMTTPHVTGQLHVLTRNQKSEEAAFPSGSYRVRTIEPGPSADFEVTDEGFPRIHLDDDGFTIGSDHERGVITLENGSARDRTIVIESRAWAGDALTGHRATTFQAFRDLFPNQVLERGDDMAVESVSFMFTDIKGSTALYERVGDGRAYEIVRDHFGALTRAVRDNNGAVVKTIGDAVMACFETPADAVRAALAAQGSRLAFGERNEEVVLKIGVHTGPSISVNLNDRLDYFGSTVNLAARLQGKSEGGDVVLSETVIADEEAMSLLTPYSGGREQAHLKGFEGSVAFYRCWPRNLVVAA